jgi:hypothetical protein
LINWSKGIILNLPNDFEMDVTLTD